MVSASGLVTFVSAGEADIRATYRTVTGTTRVTVARVVARYALDGIVTDEGNRRGVENVRVEIVDGPDAGRSTQTNSAGGYRLGDIVEGRITVRFTHGSFVTAEQAVTLASDARLDIALRTRVDVTPFYGTFNVTFSIAQQTCEFPITPGPAGQLVLSGRPDGTNFEAKIIERGTDRTYRGVMQLDGRFSGNASGPIPGFGPVILKHDFSGVLEGRVTGGSVTAIENIVYDAPCPGKIARFNLNGNK
jgi:ribosomal protein S28E/S33